MQKARGITWDLHDLYASAQDPQLIQDLEDAQHFAEQFNSAYHGKIAAADCTAELLGRALKDYESLLEKIYRPYVMATLLFAGDGTKDEYKALLSRVQDTWMRIQNATLFLALEIRKMPAATADAILASGQLGHYQHHVEVERRLAPYSLSEAEEKIINRKNLSGKTAFVNLYEEFTAAFEWELEIEGERQRLTASELRQLMRHQDPELRFRAKKAHDGRYGEHAIIFTNVFGSIVKDHATEVELRGYAGPMAPSVLHNKVPEDVVETVLEVTAANFHQVQAYCRLKARMLGMDKLRGSDLYAPVVREMPEIPFEAAKAHVLESFHAFSPEFAQRIESIFTQRWIDAEVRPGKRGGAFCHGVTPSLHPYVLLNYVDNLDSMYTMAHELGHALHDLLAAERQTLLTYHPPLVLAETASVFAEMLLTRKLLAEETRRDMRIQIIASKLEDFFGTISRQAMYTFFEREAHTEGAGRRLSAEDLCTMWTSQRDALYSDTVDFLPEEKWFWAVIPHFIHTRFYCYAYTFGALLVLALFNRYEKEGEKFIPHYRRLLSAGDSDWPENLVAEMGMDFRDRAFWEGGFEVIQSLLEELQRLI